ncbi:hypothetical protein OH77DRAFT_1399365, partial [Trametes cingulata]
SAQDYCSTAAAILLMWHYLTTFDKEVNLFWKRRVPGGACVLFLVNRYLTLLVAIYDTPWWNLSTAYLVSLSSYLFCTIMMLSSRTAYRGECAVSVYSQYIFELSQYVVWAAFSSLRVYALTKRWILAALVFMLSLVPVVANAVPIRFLQIMADPIAGCNTSMSMSETLSLGCQLVDAVSRCSLIVADTIVVIATWEATHQYRSRNLLNKGMSLSSVMYRNGAVYFVVLTVLNILHLLFSTFSIALASAATGRASFLIRFIEPITAILITHFLIDLQEAASAEPFSVSISSTPESFSTVWFARADIDSLDRTSAHSVVVSVYIPSGEECLEALEKVRWDEEM